ncbi:MAG: hypothetical protein ACFFDT_05700 [Candidatus Hodarchaeota archaeon]
MEESIIKAKEKAENFLSKTIEENWNNEGRLEKAKLEPVPYKELPLQFEAYAYLAHRHNELIPKLANKLRSIWLYWIEWKKQDKGKPSEIFWPALETDILSVSDPTSEYFQGFELESHVAMFRAMEILKIRGFEAYFSLAERRLRDFLMVKYTNFYYLDLRDIWQIVRSPTVQMLLKESIEMYAVKFIEIIKTTNFAETYNGLMEEHISDADFVAQMIFFLLMSKLSDEYSNIVKTAVLKFLTYQKNDGSFEHDLQTTFLCAKSIHLTKVDPSAIACNKVLKWLLSTQNKDGSWDHWRYLCAERGIEWRILATVIVLETIDLITNNKPLPLWTMKAIPEISLEKKQTRLQPIKPFPTPPGTSWYDVSIRFLSNETAELIAKGEREGKNFAEMGFMDKRSEKPDILWFTLIFLAKNRGEISWESQGLPLKVNRNLKSYIKDIRKRLIHLFEINDDPFESYRKVKAYRTKFKIKLSDSARNDLSFPR